MQCYWEMAHKYLLMNFWHLHLVEKFFDGYGYIAIQDA